MIAALIALLLGQAPVPPPVEQSSADCTRPVYASDQLLCRDAELRRLDAELVQLVAAGPEPQGRWIEPQSVWFRRSRTCAFQDDHAGCLAAAYRERLALLRTLRSAPEGPALACRPAGLTATQAGGGLAVRDDQGRVIALAAPAVAGWRPFLTLRDNRGRGEAQDSAGRLVIRCPLPR